MFGDVRRGGTSAWRRIRRRSRRRDEVLVLREVLRVLGERYCEVLVLGEVLGVLGENVVCAR